jgi:hypothetical protein
MATQEGAGVRRFIDPVQVITAADTTPQVFRWRGRRYPVSEVLGRWREVAPWWRLTGFARAADPAAPAVAAATTEVGEHQREVWRVLAGQGVFDLGHDGTGWVLIRVVD